MAKQLHETIMNSDELKTFMQKNPEFNRVENSDLVYSVVDCGPGAEFHCKKSRLTNRSGDSAELTMLCNSPDGYCNGCEGMLCDKPKDNHES